MKNFLRLLCTLLLISLYSCEEHGSTLPVDPVEPVEEEEDMTKYLWKGTLPDELSAVMEDINEFSWSAFESLLNTQDEAKNICFSPCGLSMNLGLMSYFHEDIAEWVNLSGLINYEKLDVKTFYLNYLHYLHIVDPSPNIYLLHAVCPKNVNEYAEFLTKGKGFENTIQFDFPEEGFDQKAKEWINSWSHGLLNSEIPIDEDIRMYVINFVNMENKWVCAKSESLCTVDKTFVNASGDEKQMPFIQGKIYHRCLSLERSDLLSLDLGYRGWCLNIAMPKGGYSFSDCLAEIKDNHKELLTLDYDRDQTISLPKFEISATVNVPELVDAIVGATDGDAPVQQLSEIYRDLGVKALQYSSLCIDDEGMQAVSMLENKVGAPASRANGEITVNRPFMFFLAEKRYATILFLGTVNAL